MTRRRKWLRPPRALRATRAGWCFVAIIFGVGFAALNTGNNLLYLVLALMLAFLVLSGLLSEASLRGVRVERRLPHELFAATDNRILLRILNEQRRVPSFALLVEDRLDGDQGPERVGRAFALRVGAGECSERSYVLAPARRGELHFDSLRVSTRFPFGLFVKSVELPAAETALVYPEIRPLPAAALPVSSGIDSDERNGPMRRGDDVAGLREFVPGDSLGRVHWRRSLRVGRLLVGEREGEAAGEVEVLLAAAGGESHAAFEERVIRATSEVVAALETGVRVGLHTPTSRFAPAAGPAHRRELLAYLARISRAALETPVDPSGPARARAAQR